MRVTFQTGVHKSSPQKSDDLSDLATDQASLTCSCSYILYVGYFFICNGR